MPASNWAYWQAFFKMHAWGPREDDRRAAYSTSIAYNSTKKKQSPVHGPEFFFPSIGPPPKTAGEEEEQMRRVCERIGDMYGGE